MARNDARENAPILHGLKILGLVQKLIPEKGFGFITGDDDTEYFFHLSNCAPGVWEDLVATRPADSRVAFVPTQTVKGSRALQVTLAE